MKLNIIDLFAGCGGLTEGFVQTNHFNTLATVDWEKATVQTLKHRLNTKWGYNSNTKNNLHFDIQRTEELINGYSDEKFGVSKGLDYIINNQKVDGIIGGPPCQAYSIAKRNNEEDKYDYRNFLFESYVKIVRHYLPRFFVFENVEGMLSSKVGGLSIVSRIKKSFNDIGYEIVDNLREKALFDTSLYGVPQKRKRVIIFGVPKSNKSDLQINLFYQKMAELASEKPTSVGKVFKNLPKIYPSIDDSKKYSHEIAVNGVAIPKNHEPRKHNQRDIEIFSLLAEDIKSGRNEYLSTKSLIKLYEEKTGKTSKFHKYHVINEDKPSNTIPAHLYKDGLRHIHPDPKQARSITVREAARIQTFDDDFEFLGSRGEQYKMVGNAVPPKFAQLIAETIIDVYKKTSIQE